MKRIPVITTLLLLAFTLPAVAQLKRTVHVPESGQLRAQLTEEEARSITHLTLTGSVNAIDFRAMRDEFDKLEFLDLTNASIKLYVGKKGTYPDRSYVYPMDCIPAHGMKDKKTLKHIILSPATKNIEDCAFQGCDNLRICEIRKKKAPNLLPGALSDSLTAIFVPLGSRDEYWNKSKWKPFNLVEGDLLTRTIHLAEPGTLKQEIRKTGNRLEDVNFLILTGRMNDADFKAIREDMPKLTGIDLAGIENTEIPAFSFVQKNFLMWVKLPGGLKKIGSRAFSGCVRLTGEIILPATAKEVSEDAFLGCERVKVIR